MRRLVLGSAAAAVLLIGVGAFVFARWDDRMCDADVLDSCGTDPGWRVTEIAGRYVVLVPETFSRFIAPFSESSFYPEPAEAEQAETAIAVAYGDLPGYRQYAGIIYQGRRYLFVNGFCQPSAIDWKENVIDHVMEDSCGFRAVYDLGNDSLAWMLFAPDRQNPGAVDPS